MVCTDGITAHIYPCMLLATKNSVCYWMNVSINVMFVCSGIV